MAVSKFGFKDWLLGWLIPQGTGGAYVQGVSLTDTTGAPIGTAANPLVTNSVASGDAVTIADGADVAQGAKADAAYAGSGSASVVAALKGIYASLVAALPAGANIIGKVAVLGVDAATTATTANPLPTSGIGFAYSNALTITRPANQTPYTAGDVVGGALTFTSMGSSAGRIMLTSSQLELDIAAIPTGMSSFILYLYNVTPPSAIADNAPWDLPSGDRASFLGGFNLGSPADLGSTCYVEQNIINKQIKLAGTSLFGYLVTVAGFTPAANSEVYVNTIHAVGLGL